MAETYIETYPLYNRRGVIQRHVTEIEARLMKEDGLVDLVYNRRKRRLMRAYLIDASAAAARRRVAQPLPRAAGNRTVFQERPKPHPEAVPVRWWSHKRPSPFEQRVRNIEAARLYRTPPVEPSAIGD